jgi:hypothetical protein
VAEELELVSPEVARVELLLELLEVVELVVPGAAAGVEGPGQCQAPRDGERGDHSAGDESGTDMGHSADRAVALIGHGSTVLAFPVHSLCPA